MQKHDLITSLPSTLSCIVLREWLNFKAVMALDSAYCCHSYRSGLLGLLESEEYFIPEKVIINADVLMNLNEFSILEKMGQKLRSVKFVYKRSWSSIEPAHNRMVTFCRNLTHVHFSTAECGRLELQTLLGSNPNIESLKLSDFSEDQPSFPSCFRDVFLSKLKTLAVKSYQLESENVSIVLKTGNVFRLNLSYSSFTGPDLIQILRACPGLIALVLSSVRIEPNIHIFSQAASMCPHIMHLDISGANTTDAEILSVVQNLTRLQSLNIIDSPRLTDASLMHIYTHCAETINTKMFSNHGIIGPSFTAEAINTMLERCTPLRRLHLFEAFHSLHPFIFNSAAIYNLTTFAIAGDAVMEQNFAIIGTYGVNLQVLEVESDTAIESLFSFVRGCANLRKLRYVLRGATNSIIPEKFLHTSHELMHVRPGLQVTVKSVPLNKSWKATKPACFGY